MRKSLCLRIFGVACMLAVVGSAIAAFAQSWPARFVTLVVPFGAGSAADTVARIVAARMSEVLGQQMIVENVAGGGGMVGISRIAKAAPDGYQVAFGGVDTFAQSQYLFKNPSFNSATDFAPVGLVAEQPLVLLTRKDLPVNNLKEFVAYVKANHGKMQFGSAGVGAAPHLACYMVTLGIGVPVTHVPYRSSAPALQDMIAGTIDFYCPLAVAAMPLIANNSVKVLAVLTRERSPLLPDVPTAMEQGLNMTDGYYWMGLFLPKGTPAPVVAALNQALGTTLDTPAVQARLKDIATTAVPPARRSVPYLQKYVEDEIAKWTAIMKTSGVPQQ
jgi:tripartite-type tricarboxylate transporter receptor subunit TctC